MWQELKAAGSVDIIQKQRGEGGVHIRYSKALALHSAAAGIQGGASFFSKPLSHVQRLVY